MDNSTISMAIFNSYVSHYQGVSLSPIIIHQQWQHLTSPTSEHHQSPVQQRVPQSRRLEQGRIDHWVAESLFFPDSDKSNLDPLSKNEFVKRTSPTINQLSTNHQPTMNQPSTNHQPTINHLISEHLFVGSCPGMAQNSQPASRCVGRGICRGVAMLEPSAGTCVWWGRHAKIPRKNGNSMAILWGFCFMENTTKVELELKKRTQLESFSGIIRMVASLAGSRRVIPAVIICS